MKTICALLLAILVIGGGPVAAEVITITRSINEGSAATFILEFVDRRCAGGMHNLLLCVDLSDCPGGACVESPVIPPSVSYRIDSAYKRIAILSTTTFVPTQSVTAVTVPGTVMGIVEQRLDRQPSPMDEWHLLSLSWTSITGEVGTQDVLFPVHPIEHLP